MSADKKSDAPPSPKEDDRLDEQLRLVTRKLQLARLEKELREILISPEVQRAAHEENKRRADFKQILTEAVDRSRKRLNLPEPVHADRGEFLQEWIVTHWDSTLCNYNLTGGIPPQCVAEALKAMYIHDYDTAENRAEIAELQSYAAIGSGRFSAFIPVLKRGPELRTARRLDQIQKLFTNVSVLFTAAAALFMFCMLTIGCLELAKAAIQGFGSTFQFANAGAGSHDSSSIGINIASSHEIKHEFLITSLTALEIILVAPLPYLLVLALNRYIKALAYQERTDEFRRELLEFKAFEVALFIAIIAATTVSHILNEKFTQEIAIPTVLIIGILATYYYIIEKASKDAEQRPKTDV